MPEYELLAAISTPSWQNTVDSFLGYPLKTARILFPSFSPAVKDKSKLDLGVF